MATTEQGTRRTITQLHTEVARFDATIEKQEEIVGTHGRNIIKEFSPAEDAQPEEIITGVYDTLQRRFTLTTRIEEGSLPYLRERREKVLEDENLAIQEAREAYEGIQTLARLGVCSPEEKDLLEEALSRLPENVASQIRTAPILIQEPQTKKAQTQEEPRRRFFARIFGRKRHREQDTPVIDAIPRPINTRVLARTTIHEDRTITHAQSAHTVEETSKEVPVFEPGQRVPFEGEIPDVSIIVGKKAILQQRILTAIFEATAAGDNFTKTDYARKLFEQEIEEGKITEDKAVKMFVDSLQWVQKKSKIFGYEIYHERDGKEIIYRVGVRKNLEDSRESGREELTMPQEAIPTLSTEAQDEDAGAEKKFPDGRFLGKEEDLARKIYAAIIDFSSQGKLPAGEDLIKILFAQDIASGAITQGQARIRVRDGLSRLRGKLKDTGMELANRGTTKFPFYKLEIKGEILDHVWNPPLNQRVAANGLTENSRVTTHSREENTTALLGDDGEEVSFPSPDVVGKDGTLKRKYYEYLLAKKADGVVSTIEEEADYIYGDHSYTMLTRVYAMRQQINTALEPYGVRIGAEKRIAKGSEKQTFKGTTAESATIVPEPTTEETEGRGETAREEAPAAVNQQMNEARSEQTVRITLRSGERKTLQILVGTSEAETMTTEEIAVKFFPGKNVRRDDMTTIQTFIAGLKAFSLPGTGIQILHPLTEDGNPILNRHYLMLPEGKTLEDLVDFESSPITQPPAVERISVPVASILREGAPVELPPAAPERMEVTLPHFIVDEEKKEIKFAGQRVGFRFADEWEVFNRIAHKPNQELTPHELAGLDPNVQDTRALERAENNFRHFITRFEEDPKNPQTFIITGGNRYPKFTFRATTEFFSDQNRNPNGSPSQWD